MSIPTDQIKDRLVEMGLETPTFSITRLSGGNVRLTITAIFNPEQFIPVPAHDLTDTLPRPAPGRVEANDLTVIPGIGKATAAKLADAGINSFAAIRATTNQTMLQFITPNNLKTVRAWLSANP